MEHSFNKIVNLLFLARQKGVEVMLNDERLQLKTGENVEIDEQLLNEIRSNKQSIIDYLASDDWKAVTVSNNHKKITPFDRNSLEHVPASFSQERLWFIDHLGGSVEYHSPTVLRLTGNINKTALSFSLKTITERHEVLRTVFYEIDGQVYQSVKPGSSWEMVFEDGCAYQNNPDGLKLRIEKLVKQPFDLATDFPIRSTLITLGAQEYMLIVTLHHIASDAWSTGIIVNEVVELYNSKVEGRNARLPLLPLQYADFSVWQRNYLQGDVLNRKIAYWKNKLEGHQNLQLPTNYGRSPVQNIQGASSAFIIGKKLTGQLHDLSQQEGASMYMALLAAFKVLLSRYSGQQDITVGTSIASRQQKDLEGMIGFFVNTLALRDEVSPQASFTELLQQVKATTLGAYENQDISFEKVVEVTVKERDPERNPLFQVMLVLANTPESPRLTLGDVELASESFVTNISKFEITFFISETPNGLSGHVDYRTDLYAASFINGMVAHYITLLTSIVASPNQKVSLLPLLGTGEELQLLQELNSSEVAYPHNKSVIDLLEEQVAKTPDAVAVVFEDEVLTYEQLNERSNQLAHCLISKGIMPDALVPLYMERSALMMVGMLGIMKAGAAYVPVDIDFPADRVKYMLEDTEAKIIVSSSTVSKRPDVNAGIEIIETNKLAHQPKDNISVKPQPHHLAYVIYTSGSTGLPKGVMVEHRNLIDYYFGLNKNIQIGNCSSFALVSTIATDLGNTVIYGSLLSGGALHVFSKDSVSNIEYLHQYFKEKEIDCVKIVPSHWKALRQGNALLLPGKLLVFGGETLRWELTEEIRLSGATCRIVNHYGPTETTIGKLLHEIRPGSIYAKTIPVGRPFSNTKVYVLTKEMQLCPPGIPGQLYISGDGVARGYYNNEKLTKEKFIADPFSQGAASQAKMYATGDLVKWLEDGNIVFISRVDDQVKIRGYRVEPGEVEKVLQQSELVSEAVVLAKPDRQGNNQLIAYIVPQGTFDREGIAAYLKHKLPEYMIPAVMVELESLPLTANGKTDRKALPDPDSSKLISDKKVAPRNDKEMKMAAIWAEVLEVEEIGIHNDFFELGGHSLLAVRLISAIRKAFEVEMPIGDIFDYPTVAALSARLSVQSETAVLPVIEVINPRPEYIPLSFSQERLWLIDQISGSQQYHVPTVLKLTGRLNIAALTSALQNVINRHEVLRTIITEQEGRPYQLILEKDAWQLPVVDGLAYAQNQEELQRYIQQVVVAPFDLSKDHMIRGHLVAIDIEEHILIVTLHHIASDGWSRSVMVKEVVEGYSAFEEGRPLNLPVLPVQYADYAIWQRNYMQGEILEKKLGYWKEKLQGLIPLQLPVDYSRPTVQTSHGASAGFKIDAVLLKKLHHLSTQHGATLFMTLLAAFKVLLYRYTDQQDICVGTPIAGRTQQELEGLIGFFVNTLALRTNVNSQQSFSELLQQVKKTTIEAYEHQEVPFERVVDVMVKERDMSRSPLFQVMFVLQNTPEVEQLKLGNLQLSAGGLAHESVKFEIVLSILETADGLVGSFGYSTDLYSSTTIDGMVIHLKELLISITQAEHQKIASLSMLTLAEKEQLLHGFNNTAVAYPKDTTIINLFEEQAAKTPRKIAVVFEEEQLTYEQLNERANRLAHYLIARGVGEETLVPLCIERGVEMIVGMLGILKAGAAYVPIDPDYPPDRISYMLQDTGAALVVSSKESRPKLPHTEGAEIIEIDGQSVDLNSQPTTNPPALATPQSLAYVIYTSGSTGTPKGVMIEHRNVYAFINWCQDEFRQSSFKMVYATTSISFDLSIFELFFPLCTGKQIRIIENGLLIPKYLPQDRAVLVNTVPTVVERLLNDGTDLSNISVLNMAGEPIPLQVHQRLDSNRIEVRNLYGPTEDTTYSTVYRLRKEEAVLIGRPIANTYLQIVNKEGQLVPVGVPGEIYIGGAGLARGYLNRPELTAEKFIPDPFSKEEGTRVYKTGDIGRWLAGGNIEYLERKDEQVKIRGYRIELGEIESVMLQSGQVSGAVVVAKGDKEGSNKQLVGYVVAAGTAGAFSREALTTYLKAKLPAYMVPAIVVELQSLPLTPNGKIDRKALPDPNISESLSQQYVAPRSEIEQKLAEIWQQVLGAKRIGIHDNFFELGGDSILTIQVVSRIRRSNYELQPKDLFVHQTIEGLANLITKRSGVTISGEQGILEGKSGLLPIQQWYLQRNFEDISHFNQSVLLGVNKSVSETVLREAVTQLLIYHDVLRFKYQKNGDEWQQSYGSGGAELIVEDLKSVSKEALSHQVQKYSEKYQQSLDIEQGKLVQVVWMQLPEKESANRLLIVIHHLAVDGVSWRILLEHLEVLIDELMKGEVRGLGSKGTSYRQWYNTLELYGQSNQLLSQINYWTNIINSNHPIPVDHTSTNGIQQADTHIYRISLAANETQRLLHEVPRAYQTEINDILLCALSQTVCNWAGTNEVVIGLEGHGREDIAEHIDISRTIGWFTSLFPVLLSGNIRKGEANLIKEVKQQLHQVPDKGLGYGVLKYINKEERFQGKDCWEIVFNYLGQLDNIVNKSSLLTGAGESSGTNISDKSVVTDKISINCVIRSGQLIVSWRYSSKNYEEQTIKGLAENYITNLQQLIAHCIIQLKAEDYTNTLTDIRKISQIKKENHKLLKQQESRFLIPIKKGMDKMPLYIICGGGGTVIKFKKMAELLDPSQPVFGLQQPTEIKYLEEFPETVEEIAAEYISEILIQNPDGPYALAGHCSGGLVAYEMSKQLEAMGKKVELLVMFDTVVPSRVSRNVQNQPQPQNLNRLKSLVKKMAFKFQHKLDFQLFLLREHTKDVFYYKLSKLKKALTKAYPQSEEEAVYEVYQRLTKIIERAAKSYDLKHYNRNVVIYYAKDHYSFYDYNRNVSYKRYDLDESIKNRWKNFTKSFELYEIEGEHSTMFDPAIGGKELARLLQNQLDNCDIL